MGGFTRLGQTGGKCAGVVRMTEGGEGGGEVRFSAVIGDIYFPPEGDGGLERGFRRGVIAPFIQPERAIAVKLVER